MSVETARVVGSYSATSKMFVDEPVDEMMILVFRFRTMYVMFS